MDAPQGGGALKGLQVADVRFTFPGYEPTLRGASLEVPAGESGFLLGPSGAGKSTLLRCIAGLEEGYRGRILCDGASIDGLSPHRRGVGMMFQEPPLFPHLNVWQNVAFGLRYRHPKVRRANEREEAGRWLEAVSFPGRPEARVDELSGGQRQRVALARTLAAKPRVVLLDEPLTALDAALRDELGPRVKGLLADQGVAALWVTHDEGEAFRLGDRVWRLVEGRCIEASATSPT
ncbi:MAG: ABC transporter ATP-binding protein [Thermoplasmatota archaeon]